MFGSSINCPAWAVCQSYALQGTLHVCQNVTGVFDKLVHHCPGVPNVAHHAILHADCGRQGPSQSGSKYGWSSVCAVGTHRCTDTIVPLLAPVSLVRHAEPFLAVVPICDLVHLYILAWFHQEQCCPWRCELGAMCHEMPVASLPTVSLLLLCSDQPPAVASPRKL